MRYGFWCSASRNAQLLTSKVCSLLAWWPPRFIYLGGKCFAHKNLNKLGFPPGISSTATNAIIMKPSDLNSRKLLVLKIVSDQKVKESVRKRSPSTHTSIEGKDLKVALSPQGTHKYSSWHPGASCVSKLATQSMPSPDQWPGTRGMQVHTPKDGLRSSQEGQHPKVQIHHH